MSPHAYLNYRPAFPKPKDAPKPVQPCVHVFRDGREMCITSLADWRGKEGREEYKRRIAAMLARQKGVCCLYGFIFECPGKLLLRDATFEHENGRGSGGGKRDDRIELPNGKWINGAAHVICNSLKGSRVIPYNDYPQTT